MVAAILAWLGSEIALKLLKLTIMFAILLMSADLIAAVIEELAERFQDMDDLPSMEVGGYSVPMFAMMEWMGVWTGISSIIGAHTAVFSVRQIYRIMGWI